MELDVRTERPRGAAAARTMMAPAVLSGTDIVCVGFADWDAELWTNQQHLMSRLGRTNRVLFIESLGLRRPTLASRDVGRMVRRLVRALRGVREADGVWVLSPLVLPWHAEPWQARLNRRLLSYQVARARRQLGMVRTVLWGYVPQAVDLVDAADAACVLYHCVDDIAEQKGVDAAAFRAIERRLVGCADLVLASASNLHDRLSALTDRVRFAPNVADTAHFARALEAGDVDPAVEELPRPRLVFTGAVVATKVDVGLVVDVARRRRDWSLVLVGPVGPGDPSTDVSALRAEPNVHLLGWRSFRDLPAVLRGADAGWIPYQLNELTRSVFPMKVYEYLSAGLEVISAPLPALRGGPRIRLAANADDVVEAFEKAIVEDTAEKRRTRSVEAAAHSWDARLEQITAWLGETCGQ